MEAACRFLIVCAAHWLIILFAARRTSFEASLAEMVMIFSLSLKSGAYQVKVAALIFGLFSGLGHILMGQALKGAIFGALFIVCLNGLLLGHVVLMGTIATTVFWSSVGCTIAVWGIAYRDLVLSLKAGKNEKI